MASSNISWLGNPVVDGDTYGKPSYAKAQYPTYSNQDLQASYATKMQTKAPNVGQDQEGPPPVTDVGYIPYYLSKNIGKSVRAEFSIGGSLYVDKTGILIEVGINYFVLRDVNSRTNIMCDLYSVKFVTILDQ